FTVQPPGTAAAGAISLPVQVVIQDAFGNTVPTATHSVTVAIRNNPSGGTLSGTTTATAANAVATFSDLSIDTTATGYTLTVSAGDAYCWGRNESGRLGDGTVLDRATPVRVAAPAGVTFAYVGTGAGYSCGLAATGGSAYCWGSHSAGELGDNSGADQFSPVLVQAPAGVTFTTLTTGFFHSCGLATNGVVYCWGANASGQLGDNTTGDKPVPVPVGAPAGVTFATLDAGYVHTCAVTPAGAAYCWGDNGSGELGDNTTVGKLVPTAVQGAIQFALVSGGGDHSCGVTTTGKGYCWGGNEAGQIGDNTTLDRLVPAANAGNLTLSIPAPGNGHSCAVATGTSATVYCWGSNAHGQLGDGTTSQRLVPTRVAR